MGFCGIAWNARRHRLLPAADRVGADAAGRLLLRRLPGGKTWRALLRQVAASHRCGKAVISRAAERTSPASRSISARRNAFFRERLRFVRKQSAWGQTTTYGAVAKALGARARRPRAMSGRPWRKIHVPLIIPCHRVLAAGGRIGGFSAPGGSTAKARMLELEGVWLTAPAPAQQAFWLLGA